jgi:pyruvate ferredoxin oxidoreductase gamma subunit
MGRALPNAVLLGGLAAFTGVVSIESVAKAIHVKFKTTVADKNVFAARKAFEWVQREMKEPARA